MNLDSKTLVSYLPSILDYFSLEYTIYSKYISLACGIHGGDNPQALVIYTREKDGNISTWRCYTHLCHQKYGSDLIGLVHGLLDSRKSSCRNDAINWIRDFKPSGPKLKIESKSEENLLKIPRSKVIDSLKIPCPYFLKRGFSSKVLSNYDIGFCATKGKPFFMRTVIPFYEPSGQYCIGVQGRTINPRCHKCKKYHLASRECGKTLLEQIWNTKYKNSKGFPRDSILFNFWSRQHYIKEKGIVILTESVCDILRLEESGIRFGLATLGTELTEKQGKIIEGLNPRRIILCPHNDENKAGEKLVESVNSVLGKPEIIRPTAKDLGDMSVNQIRELFKNIV